MDDIAILTFPEVGGSWMYMLLIIHDFLRLYRFPEDLLSKAGSYGE